MKKLIRIDTETGLFIEDVITQDNELTPNDCVETPCPDGFYKPMWNGHIWVEGLTQEQIDELKRSVIKKEESLNGDQVIDILKFNGYSVWPL